MNLMLIATEHRAMKPKKVTAAPRLWLCKGASIPRMTKGEPFFLVYHMFKQILAS